MSMSVLAGDMIKKEEVRDILVKRFGSFTEGVEDFLKIIFYTDKQITFDEFSQNCFEYLFELSDINREELLAQLKEEK